MSIRRCLVLSLILLASPGLAVAQAVAQGAALGAAQGAAGAPQVTAALLPHDLSFWGMIENADWVVKSVIAGLAVASVLTWTVALAKMVEFVLLGRAAGAGLATLRAAGSLDEAVTRIGARGTCAQLARVAQREVQASTGLPADGVKERTAWALERVAAGAGRAMGRGTGILATIGSVAPFVGLFGTVWGIMNAFIGIARSQTTNLAVVAPGIAEALLATAVGLVAAIPAVVIYNLFARATAGARARLADGVAETMRVLSRDLDRAELRGAELRGAGHDASPLPRLRIAE